jgi:hypothetical protein
VLNRSPDRRPRFGWLAVVLLPVVAACNSILDTDQAAFAYEARVIIEGTSEVPLRLVTSTNFIAVPDPETGDLVSSLVVSDTVIVTSLPYNHVFEIRGADRFLVRLTNPDIDVTVHLRVLMDEREVYGQRATMRDATLEFITYFQL